MRGRLLDKLGKLPAPPASLPYKSLQDGLDQGYIKIEIDQKLPQAVGIETMLSRVSLWGNSYWNVIHNEMDQSPFFTSDHPVALDPIRTDSRVRNWIVPLSPKLAIRIRPDLAQRSAKLDFSFRSLTLKHVRAKKTEVVAINRAIVASAESTIYFCKDLPWIPSFISKLRYSRIDCIAEKNTEGSRLIPDVQMVINKNSLR